MLNQEECNALIRFLDRTPLTGHGERQAMNVLVQKIGQMSLDQNVKPAETPKADKTAKKPATPTKDVNKDAA